MQDVFELFPTPVMRVAALLDPGEVQALLTELLPQAQQANPQSAQLAHSQLLSAADSPLLRSLAVRLGPPVVALGQLLFGEPLPWLIKELWVNLLQTGGRQALHNHANSFVSGVLYLTPCDASARTVFARGMGGPQFVFSNSHAGVANGPFNADKWVAPAPAAGDLLLFPSYLLHEVPVNAGGPRITLAFNAIPQRLDCWGYALGFNPG